MVRTNEWRPGRRLPHRPSEAYTAPRGDEKLGRIQSQQDATSPPRLAAAHAPVPRGSRMCCRRVPSRLPTRHTWLCAPMRFA
eukprot:scaffold34309_cov27-Tisochrysis_lutea.AAC.4